MKARCRMEIEFPDKLSMDAAAKAVEHEGNLSDRSKTTIGKEPKEKRLTLDIEAQDVVSLRATLNAFMRAFQVFEGITGKEDKI